jgi:hypoxanthine phosphoribosyltransferase
VGAVIFIGWSKYLEDLERLVLVIKNSKKKFDFVSGIPRGGLIPAVFISHQLDLEYKDFNFLERSKANRTLIVDDLVDTGKTLKTLFDLGYTIAVLYKKPKRCFEPHFWIEGLPDEWIVFPYEKKFFILRRPRKEKEV